MYSSYMPILSSAVFDNTGNPYNVTRILTSEFLFNQDAYQDYSRVFLPITYVLSYALQFAALPALVVHTVCWHGSDIWKQTKQSWHEFRHQIKRQRRLRRTRTSSSLISRTSSVLTSRSHRSSAAGPSTPIEDNSGTSDVSAVDDVPYMWYILTGVTMTAVGIFLVE
jgi:hypothetical protein